MVRFGKIWQKYGDGEGATDTRDEYLFKSEFLSIQCKYGGIFFKANGFLVLFSSPFGACRIFFGIRISNIIRTYYKQITQDFALML